MKGRLFFEIIAVLLVILICGGLIWVKDYFSNRLFEKRSPVDSSSIDSEEIIYEEYDVIEESITPQMNEEVEEII